MTASEMIWWYVLTPTGANNYPLISHNQLDYVPVLADIWHPWTSTSRPSFYKTIFVGSLMKVQSLTRKDLKVHTYTV